MFEKRYIMSPLLYMFESKNNGCLVYNGLNNSFVKTNKDLLDLLNEAKNNINLLEELDAEIQDVLKSNFIICSEDIVQNQINQRRFLKNYHTFQNEALNLTIAPTSACNFECFYCYEEGILHKTMDDDVVRRLINFIEEKSKKTQNNINITWYGGEPLLAVKQIGKILECLKEKAINILNQSIITNGYFLNSENFEFLKNNNIKSIQITLDGSNPETHNERRKNKDGSGSWDKILENIDNILKTEDEILISIRGNVGKDNQAEFQTLKEYLEKRWNNKTNIYIYPGILRNYLDGKSNCQYFNDIDASNFLISQGVKNRRLDFFSYTVGGCGATQYNSYLIGPEGNLYKCWNDLGRVDKIVGNINDKKETNKNLLMNYLSGCSTFEDENCKKCCLFFVCDGGCQWVRINNYMNNKNDYFCNFPL